MKILGCALLLLGFTSSAFATGGYKEIWYPSEAGGAPLHRTSAHKPVKHKHLVRTYREGANSSGADVYTYADACDERTHRTDERNGENA